MRVRRPSGRVLPWQTITTLSSSKTWAPATVPSVTARRFIICIICKFLGPTGSKNASELSVLGSQEVGVKLAQFAFLIAAASSYARADAYCTGNACADLQVTYEGVAPNGCHVVKDVGKKALHFTWGAFSGDLQPNQSSRMQNPFGGACLQYIFGNRTAVYKTPPPPSPPPSAPPPDHPGPDPTFKYLGDLYGEANQGAPAFNQLRSVPVVLDAGKEIDTAYQQSTVSCCGGGATSNLAPSQIPRGIFIKNTSGNVYWAISTPKLTGNTFSMQLYCGPQPPPGEGCNVRVSVWVKQRPIGAK
jgi:hypothetical protein